MIFSIHIEEEPVSCPRPRVTRRGRTYMPQKYIDYKEKIVKLLKEELSISSWQEGEVRPVKLQCKFIHKRPKYLKKGERVHKATRPDLDNLLKTVLDCLQDANVIKDDSQFVVFEKIEKYYASHIEEGSTTIFVSLLEENS